MSSFFNDLDDVIFNYSKAFFISICIKQTIFNEKVEEEPINAPIKEEGKANKEEIYESIHKYTFYEYDDDWVR